MTDDEDEASELAEEIAKLCEVVTGDTAAVALTMVLGSLISRHSLEERKGLREGLDLLIDRFVMVADKIAAEAKR